MKLSFTKSVRSFPTESQDSDRSVGATLKFYLFSRSVAQWLEHPAYIRAVVGSSPTGPTEKISSRNCTILWARLLTKSSISVTNLFVDFERTFNISVSFSPNI